VTHNADLLGVSRVWTSDVLKIRGMRVGECVMIGMVRWELSGSGAGGVLGGAAPVGDSESSGTVAIPIARVLRS